jgi:hypothetical protein
VDLDSPLASGAGPPKLDILGLTLMRLCECGCGLEAVNRYVWGHNPSPRKSYKSSPTARERLHSRVRVDENGCFLWSGTQRGDYGSIVVDGRRLYAHRLSYELHVGVIEVGDVVHHVCGQKLCVNPHHLEKRSVAEHTKMHKLGSSLMDSPN